MTLTWRNHGLCGDLIYCRRLSAWDAGQLDGRPHIMSALGVDNFACFLHIRLYILVVMKTDSSRVCLNYVRVTSVET